MCPLPDFETRPLRKTIVGVLLVGLQQRNPGAIVNAVAAFVGTYLPEIVNRLWGVDLDRWQRQYIDAAMGLHAVGMLGPYDEVWWWDRITHTLSGSILGGVAFAEARRRGRNSRVDVIGTVFVFGVLWELLEYGIHTVADRLGFEPILVVYSRRDIVLDIVCNLLGALVVLALGDRALGNVSESADRDGLL